MRAEPGKLLAQGREADVFEAGPGRILRRYRNRVALDNEVTSMRWAHQHGYPAPELYDVDGADMLIERIHGRTMLSDLSVHPWRVRSYADLLARLHLQLHAVPAPPDLELRYPGGGDSFLHLDLHPENVIMGHERVAVIDWAGARRGHPAVDVAYSWVILAASEIPGDAITRALAGLLRNSFIGRFLSHFRLEEVGAQLAAVATHRLEDQNVTDGERELVRRLVRRQFGDM